MGASTNVTSVLWGTAWTANTLLAHTIRSLQDLERRDGQRRVFRIPWQRVADEVPAYGRYVRSEIARLGADHPLIRTQYALQEIDGQAGMFPPATQALMQGRHPRARTPDAVHLPENAQIGAYVLTIDVSGESENATEDHFLRAEEPRRDSTALTVFAATYFSSDTQGALPRFHVLDRYYWTGKKHHAMLPTILRIAELWQARQVVIDATGIGAGLAGFLVAELGPRVLRFTFSSQSKSRLGWDFLALCNTGRFLDHADDRGEEYAQFWREVRAADYTISDSATRRMRWGVADPRVHDDLLISAALVATIDDLPSANLPSHIINAPDIL